MQNCAVGSTLTPLLCYRRVLVIRLRKFATRKCATFGKAVLLYSVKPQHGGCLNCIFSIRFDDDNKLEFSVVILFDWIVLIIQINKINV